MLQDQVEMYAAIIYPIWYESLLCSLARLYIAKEQCRFRILTSPGECCGHGPRLQMHVAATHIDALEYCFDTYS